MKRTIEDILVIVGIVTALIASQIEHISLMYAGASLFLVGICLSAPARVNQRPNPLKKTGYPWPTDATRLVLLYLVIAAFEYVSFLGGTKEATRISFAILCGIFLIYALIEAIRDYRWRGPRER